LSAALTSAEASKTINRRGHEVAALRIVGRKLGVDVGIGETGCFRVGFHFGNGLGEGARAGPRR